jgi:hypothetical protein
MTTMNDILKGGRPKQTPEHNDTRHASLPERDAPGSGVLAGVDRRPDGTPAHPVLPRVRIRDKRKGNTRFALQPAATQETPEQVAAREEAELLRKQADEAAASLRRRTS